MTGKERRSAPVGWYWRSSPSYLGSAGGAHGLTDDGGGSSRPSAIPMITKNCVAPKKEIFTRTPRAPQERFITFNMADRELKCRGQTLQELPSAVLLAPVRGASFRAFGALLARGSCRIKKRVGIAFFNLPSLSQVFVPRNFTKSR